MAEQTRPERLGHLAGLPCAQWRTVEQQRRRNGYCRQQRFPFPGDASDVTIALGVVMG